MSGKRSLEQVDADERKERNVNTDASPEVTLLLRYGDDTVPAGSTAVQESTERFARHRAEFLALQEQYLTTDLDEERSEDTKERVIDPLVLACGWFANDFASTPKVFCPITKLHATLRDDCPWKWAATLGEFVDNLFGGLANSDDLRAMLKRELREIVAIQDDNGWALAYVLRSRDGPSADSFWHGTGGRSNMATAFGNAPASEAEIETATEKLAEQEWTFDSSLVAFWQTIHQRFWPVPPAKEGLCNAVVQSEKATYAPSKCVLKADIDPDVFDDLENVAPEDVMLLTEDDGSTFYVMWRVDKESNRQIVVNWDHEEPGAELEDEGARSFIDWLQKAGFNE